MLLRAVDYVQRGKKSCEEAAENLLNKEPVSSYYRGKAVAVLVDSGVFGHKESYGAKAFKQAMEK